MGTDLERLKELTAGREYGFENDPGPERKVPDEELFALLAGMGKKPEDIVDPAERAGYEAYLKANHPA